MSDELSNRARERRRARVARDASDKVPGHPAFKLAGMGMILVAIFVGRALLSPSKKPETPAAPAAAVKPPDVKLTALPRAHTPADCADLHGFWEATPKPGFWISIIQTGCDAFVIDYNDEVGPIDVVLGQDVRYENKAKGGWKVSRRFTWVSGRKRLWEEYTNTREDGLFCYGHHEYVRLKDAENDGIAVFGKVTCSGGQGDKEEEKKSWWIAREVPWPRIVERYPKLVAELPATLTPVVTK